MLSDCYRPQHTSSTADVVPPPPPSSVSSSLQLELGLLHNASGSSYLETCGTKIICSVHGPYARTSGGSVFSSSGQLECDVKYASSAAEFADKMTTVKSQTVVDALRGSLLLERYSKMTIAVNIVVLETDGCELAHAICCASLALLDAGIEMMDLICATCAVKMNNGEIVVDPSRSQVAASENCVTVATVPTTGDVTQLCFDGKDDMASVFALVQKCSEHNITLRQSFRERIISLKKI